MARAATRNTTNVKDLRRIIEGLPDDTVLVVPASDHSFHEVGVCPGTALFDRKSLMWTQDCGEELTPEAEYGKRVNVLIIGD